MFINQIKQAGMTYTTQRVVWWGLILIGMIVAPQVLAAAAPNRSSADAAQGIVMIFGMPMLFVLPFLVGHAKIQFAHPRSILTPDFLPAHLFVLGGILIAILVAYPLLLSLLTPFGAMGFLALSLAIGAPAMWGAHLNRFGPMIVALAAFYSLLTNWGTHWWIIDAAEHQLAHALILLAGCMLVGTWLWRVSHLTEEMDDYQNLYQILLARRTGTEAVEQRRALANQVGRNRLQSWLSDLWYRRLAGYHGGGFAGIHRLLRYGFAPVPIEFQGFLFATFIVLFGLFLNNFSTLAKSGANFGAMAFFVQFSVLLPGQMAGEFLAQRRPRLAFESLLPMSRPQFVDGLLAVSIRNSLILWLMMNVAIGIVVILVKDSISLEVAAMYVLLSVATMFASAALSLRVAMWQSRAARFALAMGSWIALLIPMGLWWYLRERSGDWPFAIFAVVVAAIGCGLYLSARRAWLNLELG